MSTPKFLSLEKRVSFNFIERIDTRRERFFLPQGQGHQIPPIAGGVGVKEKDREEMVESHYSFG